MKPLIDNQENLKYNVIMLKVINVNLMHSY